MAKRRKDCVNKKARVNKTANQMLHCLGVLSHVLHAQLGVQSLVEEQFVSRTRIDANPVRASQL